MWEAFGPTQKRTSTGLMPGRGSRAGERENQEDVMNHVRVKNPEKNPEKMSVSRDQMPGTQRDRCLQSPGMLICQLQAQFLHSTSFSFTKLLHGELSLFPFNIGGD